MLSDQLTFHMEGLDLGSVGSSPQPISPAGSMPKLSRRSSASTHPLTANAFIDSCVSHDSFILVAAFLHRKGMNELAKTSGVVKTFEMCVC